MSTQADSYLVVQVFPDGTHGRFLERRPYDGAWTWLASSPRYATPLTKDDAEMLTKMCPPWAGLAVVIPDVLHRAPEVIAVESETAP